MPACVKFSKFRLLLLLLVVITTVGCDQPVASHRFEVQGVDLNWSNGRLKATLHQNLMLSNEAKNALQHGVPLTVQVELILRNTVDQTRIKKTVELYEIHYLPLSDHFQLTLPGGNEIRTFPRLRHLLADLSTVQMSFSTGALPTGTYELLARTRMDRRKLPPPMRLPMLFSSQWQHDSDWSAWPLEVHPQA